MGQENGVRMSSDIEETKREILHGYNEVWKSLQLRTLPKNHSTLAETARRYKNFSGIEELIEDFLRKNPFDHKVVLSIGCGAGKDVEKIKKLFPSAQAYGIDMAGYALQEAKKHSDADFICASAERLPFREDLKFDMLIAGQILDIFPNEEYLKRIAGELTKYSSKGARFYMAFYGFDIEDLELNKCTPIGNTLDNFGWKIIHGDVYSQNISDYSRGVFWVKEKH